MSVATLSRMAPEVPDGFVLVSVAAGERNISRRTLERWIKAGTLRAVRVPGIRQMVVSREDLRRLFEPKP